MHLAACFIVELNMPYNDYKGTFFAQILTQFEFMSQQHGDCQWQTITHHCQDSYCELFNANEFICFRATYTKLEHLNHLLKQADLYDILLNINKSIKGVSKIRHVLWWVNNRHQPDLYEVNQRLSHLTAHSNTQMAFTLGHPVDHINLMDPTL